MNSPSPYNDYSPITWFRRIPIYVTTILTVLMVIGMFATVFLRSAGFNMSIFAFIPSAFWHGVVWQIFTYVLISTPQFFYIFGLFFFFLFGTDVERYLGRSRYLQLLFLLLLVPPVILSLWWKTTGINYIGSGYMELTIGFFIAYTTLYPNLEFWGWIPMKWVAFACIALDSMNYLPTHDWPGLSVMLGSCAAGFGYIRFLQTGAEMPPIFKNLFKRRPKFKVVPRESPHESVHESIDPLLDKISKHGLSSLTAKERAQLQRARESLLKKQD